LLVISAAAACRNCQFDWKRDFSFAEFIKKRMLNIEYFLVFYLFYLNKGAYPENPSYRKKTPVGAASSREIK